MSCQEGWVFEDPRFDVVENLNDLSLIIESLFHYYRLRREAFIDYRLFRTAYDLFQDIKFLRVNLRINNENFKFICSCMRDM